MPENPSHRIEDLQKSERPRERLQHYGAGVLTSAELVAILLSTGTKGESVLPLSQRILSENGGLSGLMRMDFAELKKINGVGEVKATKLKAALEIGRRLVSIVDDDKIIVSGPEDVSRLLGVEMASLEREELRAILLNTKNHVVAVATVAHGTVSAANVRMAEVFAPAVRRMTNNLILVHNHPTGDPTPSAADISFTQDAIAAGKLLDIEVLDHIIIGQGRHASIKRLGLVTW